MAQRNLSPPVLMVIVASRRALYRCTLSCRGPIASIHDAVSPSVLPNLHHLRCCCCCLIPLAPVEPLPTKTLPNGPCWTLARRGEIDILPCLPQRRSSNSRGARPTTPRESTLICILSCTVLTSERYHPTLVDAHLFLDHCNSILPVTHVSSSLRLMAGAAVPFTCPCNSSDSQARGKYALHRRSLHDRCATALPTFAIIPSGSSLSEALATMDTPMYFTITNNTTLLVRSSRSNSIPTLFKVLLTAKRHSCLVYPHMRRFVLSSSLCRPDTSGPYHIKKNKTHNENVPILKLAS